MKKNILTKDNLHQVKECMSKPGLVYQDCKEVRDAMKQNIDNLLIELHAQRKAGLI